MPITIVNISTLKNRSRYLLLPILVGIVAAITSVPFVATASDSSAASWSGWAALDTIVVVSPTDAFLDQAATELQDYLGQISSRSWNITYTDPGGPAVRLVVDPANANLSGRNNDSVHLLTDSAGITLTGKTTIAARHGAYLLLEDLGVRWFYSNDAWTVVPSTLDPLPLGLERVEEPFFVERGLGNPVGYMALISGAVQARDDWRARNLLGGWDEYTTRHSWQDFANKFDVAVQDPTAVCYKADGISPQQILPYHQVNIDRALAYARDWFDNDPTGGRRMAVPISPPDGNMIWCDEWRVDGKYHYETISNYVFELTNVVARMLQVEYPGKYASVLSYSNYSDVPSIALEPNVYVQITDFTRGDQSRDERIAGFQSKNVFTGYYDYFDVWPWWLDRMPPPGKFDFFVDSIKQSANNNLQTFYAEGSDGWAPKGRLYWVTTRMLWDPTLNSDQLLDEFYSTAFGPASDVMDRFYTRLDNQTHDDRVWGLAFRDLDNALNIATSAGDTEVAERIRQTTLHSYFWWRWGDQIEANHTGFASVNDATDLYTFVQQVMDLQIVTGRSQETAIRSTLENSYGLTSADVDALSASATPHTPTDVQTLLTTTLNNWNGQVLADPVLISISDVELVPLGDDTTPAIEPINGFKTLEVIVPSSGNETIEFEAILRVATSDTVQVFDPQGTLIKEAAVPWSGYTGPGTLITFDAVDPGNYSIRPGYDRTQISISRPAAVNIPNSGTLTFSTGAYFYVPAGTLGLVVSLNPNITPLTVTKPDGTIIQLTNGTGQFVNPITGVWKLEATGDLNDGNPVHKTLEIIGVAPLLWHDPAQLLIPATIPTASDDTYTAKFGEVLAITDAALFFTDTADIPTSLISMPDVGDSTRLRVGARGVQKGSADTVQLKIIYDESVLSISDVQCTGMYSPALASVAGTLPGVGSWAVCAVQNGPNADEGSIIEFTVNRQAPGDATISLSEVNTESEPMGTTFINAGVKFREMSPPVIVNRTASVNVFSSAPGPTYESLIKAGVLVNDTDPQDDPLSITVQSGPTHGTLTLNSNDGTFAYDPESGFSGSDSFTYVVSDGVYTSESALVTIAVGATVFGEISLQAVPAGSAGFTTIAPSVMLTLDGSATSVEKPVAADGTFSIEGIAYGTYTITAIANGFQSAERIGFVVADPDITMPNVELKIGFVNGDSQIDAPDLSLVVGSYGYYTSDRTDSFNNWVDLNGDGAVSALDISPVIANIGLWGTQSW
jgi:hypothetical protein